MLCEVLASLRPATESVLMRLTMRASSRDAALHAAAELRSEGYQADISIRGLLYFVQVEYGEADEASVIRRVHTHDPGARKVDWV